MKMSLPLVFKEICGEKKKYITFRRMISSYLVYKNLKQGTSEDFKLFFDLLFSNLIKNEGTFTGKKVKKAKKLTTANCKKKRAISKLLVLTNEDKDIKGLQIVYDDFFKNNLFYAKNTNSLYVNLEIDLGKIDDELSDNKKLSKFHNRDAITHIFGTFEEKITFLGFKCRSGKTHYIGSPKGEPFLYGVPGKQFHYIKVEISDGITGIEPYFIPTKRLNPFLRRELKDINEKFVKEDKPIYEETLLNKIKDHKNFDKIILNPFISDDFFFNNRHHHNGKRHVPSYSDICPIPKRFWNGEERHYHKALTVDMKDIMKDIEQFNKNKAERRKRREERRKQRREKFPKRNHTQRYNIKEWNGASTKDIGLSHLLSDKGNYEKLINSIGDNINEEIGSKKREIDIIDSNNFYDYYLQNNGATIDIDDTQEEVTHRRGIAVGAGKGKSTKLDDLHKRFSNVKKKLIELNQKAIEKEEEEKELLKKSKMRWMKLSKKISRNSGLFILKTIGAVIQALTLLQKAEDNINDKSLTIEKKIQLYKVLTENKHIVDFLSQAREERIKREEEKFSIIDEDEEEEEVELKEDDLPIINAKIKTIEEEIKKDPSKKKTVSDYYEQLKKYQYTIIFKLNEEQKEIMMKDSEFDAEKELQKAEEERQRIIEEEAERIAQQEEEERNKMKAQIKITSIKNVDIPKDTLIYKGQKLCQPGKDWTDDIFTPEKKNLCPIDSKGNWILPEDIEEEDVEDWQDIQWSRVSEIFESEDYQVFLEGANSEDIIQGGLGDCYFLSAIAALCKFPSLVAKLFYVKDKSKEHCYGVYLRINGKWELVLVDDYIPCFGGWGKNFAFSSTNGNELWVILLEKAWAKINGSYAKIIGGQPNEVFDVITNAYSEKIDISSRLSEEIWNKMMEGEKNGFIMTAGTSGDTYNLDMEDVGLVPGHAYTILGVKEIKVGGTIERLVHIRNPWGNGEWSGDWSDESEKWTPALKRMANMGKEQDDGEFFMSYKDFIKYYVVLGICKLYDDYVSTLVRYEPEEVEKGCRISKVEVIEDDTNLFIEMHQKNPRIILKSGEYQKPVTIYMLLLDKNFEYIASNTNCEMNLCIETTLNKGTYYLISDINYRYVQPDKLHGYNITSYSSSPVGLFHDNEHDAIESLHKGLYSYAMKNINPINDLGGKVYQSKRYSKELPFTFSIVKNDNTNNITITDTITHRGKRSVVFYGEGSKENDKTISKTIKPNSYEVFIHMPFTTSSLYDYSLSTENKIDNAEIVFEEEGEEIDEDGYLKEYVHETKDGYLIGISNSSRRMQKLKILLEGLYDIEYPTKEEVPFTLLGNSRKVFTLKLKKNYTGEVSYMFDYQ